MSGYIPEKIVYVLKPTETVCVTIDGTPLEPISVNSAYVCDSCNQNTIENGRRWAKGYKDIEIEEVYVPNSPITNVRLVDLEYRGEGGRAYKVVVDNRYYVDLREDILFDAMILYGVEKNGKINGNFIWARVGSQMKLILEGSKIYNECIEYGKIKNLKKITNYEMGGIYRSKSDHKVLYLGKISTTAFTLNHSNVLECNILKNVHCFLTTDFGKNHDKKFENIVSDDYMYLDFVKTGSYVEKIGHIYIPDDWIEILKNRSLERFNTEKNIRYKLWESRVLNIGELHPVFHDLYKKRDLKFDF